MFRYHGGQVVSKGTYWNLSTGTSMTVTSRQVLPGDAAVRYLKASTAGIFLCYGPLAGLLFVCFIPALFALILLMSLPRVAHASSSDPLASSEAEQCLGCHSDKGMVKTFKSGETLPVSVDAGHFKGTVHAFLDCTGCHSDVSLDNHPSAQYATKRDFSLHVAQACRSCHSEAQLIANPVHRNAAIHANAPPCSQCHGSHAVRRVPGWKEKAGITQYCLTCHRQTLSTSIHGSTLSLTIKEKALKESVHGSHACTDCHADFSKDRHPVSTFGSVRELSIGLAEACRRCHPDKYEQYQGSLHSTLVAKGSAAAPMCTDCHGAHEVGPKALSATLSGQPCKTCHEDVFESFSSSVHGSAHLRGKKEAPVCSSCHFAHDVKPAMASRTPASACMGCHDDAADLHNQWLPNAGLHLEAVACTACHVPDSERNIYVRITDGATGRIIPREQLRTILGPDYEILARAHTSAIDGPQFWAVYRKLKSSNVKTTMVGSMGLNDCKQSHRLAPKAMALRQCDSCHSATSASFKNVSLITTSADGREERYPVDRVVLGSLYSFVPLKQFYALGGTRLKALDYLGLLMIIGAVSVVAVHSAARLMAARAHGTHQGGHGRKGGHS